MDLSTLPWKDIAAIATGSVGAVLGVMNTWSALNQKKVRLAVRPSHAFFSQHDRPLLGIEIINLSAFPVTIREVGVTLNGRRADKGERAVLAPPIIMDGKPWPRRLDPRDAVSTYAELSSLAAHVANGHSIGRAYARTSCEEYRYGESPALSQICRELMR